MSGPERVHINWNASDGYELFAQHDIPATANDRITPEHIMTVLASQAGQLFRLTGGWSNEFKGELTFSVRELSTEGLVMRNHTYPPFIDTYVVAEEPPPQVTTHGDYQFDLVKVDSY